MGRHPRTGCQSQQPEGFAGAAELMLVNAGQRALCQVEAAGAPAGVRTDPREPLRAPRATVDEADGMIGADG